MAYALEALKFIQISNVEGTVGTAEAATEVLLGVVDAPYHDKVWHQPEQDRGSLARNVEAHFQVSSEVEGSIETELYDRFAVFVMSNSIRGNITPTQPDDSNEPNHYLWTIEPGITTANTPDITNGIDTFTIEYGDNLQGYEVEYLVTREWEISGTVNEPAMINWTWFGRQVTESTKTGALAAPTTHEYFAVNKGSLYVDTSYANIGNTQKTGMLMGFTAKLETGFQPLFAADGNYYYSGVVEERKALELELVLWRDGTNSEAIKDLFLAGSITYIRVALLGVNEMDSSQSNPPYIYIDGAFRVKEWENASEESGGRTETIQLESVYDVTAGKQFGVSIGTQMDDYA